MSRFQTALDLQLMTDADNLPLLSRQDRQLYIVMTDFIYESDVAGVVIVPKGYVTDLCTVPQIMMVLFGETAQEPSVPHDYVYTECNMSRKQADKMLYEACLITRIPKWKAILIYLGARIGGGSHWGTN